VTKQWNFDLFIDGKWDNGETGGRPIEVINPATEEVIGSVPEASTKDTVRAIKAARRAFDEGPWPWMKPAERAGYVRKMGEILMAKSAELRELMLAQTGAAGFILDFVQAGGSIGMWKSNADIAEHTFKWVEADAPTAGATSVAGSALFREPVGVVGAITPFNFPFLLNTVKSAPALAAGCTVVLKPHPWTPLDAMLIAQAAEEAGLPPGVFNVVVGHVEVGEELTTSPMVDMITMTGSTATGKRIMAAGAPTMKRLHLELGGKSAQVVLDDCTEDYARSIGFGAVLTHCGQGCVIQTRLLLPEHLLDAYKDGVKAALAGVKIGNPADPTATLGPLIREQQRLRVEGLVQSGIDEGAEVVCGARRPDGFDKGFFYEPTVLIGTNDMRIAQEEIFGPVFTVIPYSGKDKDAVRIANDSIYGLGGGVVSASTARAMNVARQIRAGSMSAQGIGGGAATDLVARQIRATSAQSDGGGAVADLGPGRGQGPGWGTGFAGIGQRGAFGGFKQSGVGRERGEHGFAAFTEIKSLSWN
jgi:acyl-CoA reductase-like NAD-dependent aldehyde dehydrogenase